jgi:hypothetical protein
MPAFSGGKRQRFQYWKYWRFQAGNAGIFRQETYYIPHIPISCYPQRHFPLLLGIAGREYSPYLCGDF